MKLKDLIGLSLVSIFLFPVVLVGIMLATGVVHIEFGNGKDKERLKETFTASDAVQKNEAEVKQLKAYKAAELKEKEVSEREAEAAKEAERLEALKLETDKAKEEITQERRRIEELVGKNTEIQDKQIASLAEVYGGMRPEEAAPILLSLDNALVVRILRKIPETRSTSKLMAALAALDVQRAATLTALLGGKALPGGKEKEKSGPAAAADGKPNTDKKPEAAPKAAGKA